MSLLGFRAPDHSDDYQAGEVVLIDKGLPDAFLVVRRIPKNFGRILGDLMEHRLVEVTDAIPSDAVRELMEHFLVSGDPRPPRRRWWSPVPYLKRLK
ncbi:MAG TPA: hypothetical protein VEB59_12375 [Gemmatimonadales bacterium]|nr:hypothetical protein [Gemmatimonadales bacterium]